MGGQIWEVVGGADKGGILVREAKELASPQRDPRLSVGALVEELDLQGERLRYRRLTGTGPDSGWVSRAAGGKTLVVKTDKKPPPKFDPYAVLGVPSDATDAMIKSAFRKASVKCHPDRNPDDEGAAEKFRELTRAKEFLLNPLKRLLYNAQHRLIKPKVNEIWWSDWDEIFDEIDASDELVDGAAHGGASPSPPAPLASPADARTDILVVGATGMVGTMACMVLQKDHGSRFTWAIAGRDGRKLDRLQDRFGRGGRFRGAFRAEAEAEWEALASTARVVVDFRGPMYQVGPSLGRACVRAGTHYLMNTGDHLFVKALRDEIHGEADKAGVCAIFGAGSIAQLADFGTWHVVRHLRDQCGLPTRSVHAYTHSVGQMISGSMIATGLARDRKQVEKETKDGGGPFFLGGMRRCGMRPEDEDDKNPSQDPYSNMWGRPVESPEAHCVRCSCGLFDASQPWGDEFMFKHWNLYPDKRAADESTFYSEYAKRFYEKNIKDKRIPPPGCGPNERLRQESFLTMVFVAEAEESGDNPHTVHCILRAGPGGMADRFEGAATIALEAAFCLLDAVDGGHAGGLRAGLATPTWHLAHLGHFERLAAKGFNFKIVDGRPDKDYFKNLISSTLPIGDDL